MEIEIEGEYYLKGVREMVSGFLFKPGGEFQFFFVYGALDRFGSGTWIQKGDTIILNSKPKPASDFLLVNSSRQEGEEIRITMEQANTTLQRHVFCSLENGKEGSWEQMDEKGSVNFS